MAKKQPAKSTKSTKRKQAKSQPTRTLTVMEGRDENIAMVEGFEKAAKNRGWDFCRLTNINSDLLARYDFDTLPLDYVIFRELSNNNYYEVDRVLYWLKANNKLTLNTDIAGGRMSTSDKHFQQGLFLLDPFLKDYALPTFEAKHKDNVMSYINGGRVHFPIVLKPRRGTTGVGITLINSEEELDKIENLWDYLIEQYVKPDCDFRVFVIGGTAVGTMRKTGNLEDYGDFESWCSGRDKHLETNPEVIDILSEIATRAADISRLGYVGVDIIREKDTGKYYILETNIAAGWLNFTPITHIDIPDLTIQWFEDVDDGRKLPFKEAVSLYLEKRRQYLPTNIQKVLDNISKSLPTALNPVRKTFARYPDKFLYDAGYLFNRLAKFYEKITKTSEKLDRKTQSELKVFLHEVESTPFSWAGNFIGPEVGTFHDGAVLSALYLFLRQQLDAS